MNKHPTKPSTGRSKMEGVGTSGDHGNKVTDQEQKMYAPEDNSALNFVDASILSKLEHTSSCAQDNLSNPAYHDDLSELVSNFWKLEAVGIVDDPTQKDDVVCLQFFNDTITYSDKDQRYVVKLPFKSDPSGLPDNFTLAFSRLRGLLRSLMNNHTNMKKYDEIIKDQLRKEIIEPVPTLELSKPSHYLSHHGVVKRDNNNEIKIRCVFDGSAKMKGNMSINEILHRGPVLLPDLTGILIRCRFPPVLVISDIEKAFLMVALHPECRDYTRFLWVNDTSKPVVSTNIVTYRFTRVPFGLICSPFLLSGTIHHHLTKASTTLSQGLLRNTYVDNVFYGVENAADGKKFYADSKELFRQAGMNLREYASNSPELNKFLEETDGKVSRTQKLLGLRWDICKDELIISLPRKKSESTRWTKRKVLREVASIYDPLGIIAPVTLIGKLFLQSLWKTELRWDDVLPNESFNQWQRLVESWSDRTLNLNRIITDTGPARTSDFELHVFTDASGSAYCAVAYLVHHRKSPPHQVSFVMAKSRLAPLHQSLTIPRLELSALCIGAKLLSFITTQMDVEIRRKFLWTDSTVALRWTNTDKTVPIFIRNRVKTIRTLISGVDLRYVPTKENPADIGSRGTSFTELLAVSQWWNGPDFLKWDEESWPPPTNNGNATAEPSSQNGKTTEMSDETMRREYFPTNFSETVPCLSTSLLDTSRFSSWNYLLNTVSIVLRFLTMKSKKAASIFGSHAVLLRVKAERILFRQAQCQTPPNADMINRLHLFICEETNLWKSRGRIDNSTLQQDAITPTFLPHTNRITTLFILHIHTENNHCGLNHTLTQLRLRVWIPKGRTTVKKVLKNECFYCKRYNAKPFALPPFPLHPSLRVTPPRYPFQNVGMDFFGPMFYRSSENTPAKYWILLLTCLNSRAIYVDLAFDVTSLTVIHILRRFIATNGCPNFILCDNALSFKAIARCYSSFPEANFDEDILDYCSKKLIQIKFIPSLSPWQGGLYEKMVDVFKRSYLHATGNSLLGMEDVKTLMKETEAIVNTRPLTYISDDREHFPLRPIDFLRPHVHLAGPYPQVHSEECFLTTSTHQTLTEDWMRTSQLLSKFWERWITEYITSLREHYKNVHPKPRSHVDHQPKENDYVLIQDPSLARGQWKMGQIIGSQDDYRRSVEIRLASNKIITRPNSMVHKLEIQPMSSPIPLPLTHGQGKKKTSSHPMVTRSKTREYDSTVTTKKTD